MGGAEVLGAAEPGPRRGEGSPQKDGAPSEMDEGSPQKDEAPSETDEGSPKKDEAPSETDEGSPKKDGASSEMDEGSPKRDEPFPKKDEGSPRKGERLPRRDGRCFRAAAGSPGSAPRLPRAALPPPTGSSPSSTFVRSASSAGWPSSPRPSSPRLPPTIREKREKSVEEGLEALSLPSGRGGGWEREGQPRRGGSLRPAIWQSKLGRLFVITPDQRQKRSSFSRTPSTFTPLRKPRRAERG
jgi:hypothetical protein